MEEEQKIFIEKLKISFGHFNSQFELNSKIFENYNGLPNLNYKTQMLLEFMAAVQDNLYVIGGS